MPELPDVVAYVEALQPRIVAQAIRRVRIESPFVLRSFEPPVEAVEGRAVERVGRLGKRIVLELGDELFVVIHPMIAGRFRWLAPHAKSPGKITLARFEFDTGVLVLTEAAQKKRASIHIVQGGDGLGRHRPDGLELLDPRETHVLGEDNTGAAASVREFAAALRSGNNTLKRALTDPHRFSGIGNAYSDEILHAARLSPVTLTSKLNEEEVARLFEAARGALAKWIAELRREFADHFPGAGEITAFRPGFAVHGKFGQPCPVCGAKVQRIRYAENETNYCPGCQTGGRLLADRSLSRLLKDDWPRSVDELEERG
jgi:formamidopyrimidine-DNA glycosylase